MHRRSNRLRKLRDLLSVLEEMDKAELARLMQESTRLEQKEKSVLEGSVSLQFGPGLTAALMRNLNSISLERAALAPRIQEACNRAARRRCQRERVDDRLTEKVAEETELLSEED